MKKLLSVAVLAAIVLGFQPSPAQADVLELYPAQTITLATCTSGGAAATTVTNTGYYELHVKSEDAVVCYAATCATGGMDRKTGNHGTTYIRSGTQVSCRSTGSSAVVQLVPGGWIR